MGLVMLKVCSFLKLVWRVGVQGFFVAPRDNLDRNRCYVNKVKLSGITVVTAIEVEDLKSIKSDCCSVSGLEVLCC